MNKAARLVKEISQQMDYLAGLCITAVMLLVVSNVLLRVFLHRPILGTYEYVNMLTAVGIGLALAHCAYQKGHIAVDFLLERFSRKLQTTAQILTNIIALSFWSMSAWYVAKYARTMLESNTVSPTTQFPLWPVVFLIAFGLMALSLVLTLQLTQSLQMAFAAGLPDGLRPAGFKPSMDAPVNPAIEEGF
jgi:TRAP-type C4-dicarboxylate transport system permease small subunit